MAQVGSLIPVHSHDNKSVLDCLSENDKKQLLYNGKIIDAALSEKDNNLIERLEDGLYIDGSVLSKFTYVDGVLKFRGIVVSQEYDERSVKAMIYDLWKEYDEEVSGEEATE